jgi:N-acetylglucosaminyldiphosphoundecaprenol N-acetyl-beta-D-mannosaminyltransferase
MCRAPNASNSSRAVGRQLRLGELWVDVVSSADALSAIKDLVERRDGGTVFTPNVDHVVLAERHLPFRRAYAHANLTLADGMPLLWASWTLGETLPEKLSGSDMVIPLARLAAAHGWRVYLFGGRPGAAAATAQRLKTTCGLSVVGFEDTMIDLADETADAAIIERIGRARADVVFVALGTPKQELWCDRVRSRLAPALLVGVGASFDFLAGYVRRCPSWVSRIGLEWLFRLLQEPRRLWRRYLVDDRAFAGIVWRTARRPRAERVRVRRQ